MRWLQGGWLRSMSCWYWWWIRSILIRFCWQRRGYIIWINFLHKNSIVTRKLALQLCSFVFPCYPIFHIGPFSRFLLPDSNYITFLKGQFSGATSLKLVLSSLSSIHRHLCTLYLPVVTTCEIVQPTSHFTIY